ncbi:putative holin-like toxin [Bacillus sp. FJAT-27986]
MSIFETFMVTFSFATLLLTVITINNKK